jgi:hypothetical protein
VELLAARAKDLFTQFAAGSHASLVITQRPPITFRVIRDHNYRLSFLNRVRAANPSAVEEVGPGFDNGWARVRS